ncbi:cytochrome P450 [Panaeolus papilionaceus]|nr:cytochrome P450 [Panaeolus papilionaceus]
MPTLVLLLTSFIFYVLRKSLAFRKAIQNIHNHPGTRVAFAPWGMLDRVIAKRMPGIVRGSNYAFENKHSPFLADGCDIRSLVSVLPEAQTFIILADAAAAKEVNLSRARFPKPMHLYRTLALYGNNIVASEGDEWKKYRKICAPAYSDRNNKLVWDESVKAMIGLFNEVWKGKESIVVNHVVEITLPIALFIISVAGFGRDISWADDEAIPSGHTMSFKDALHIQSTDYFIPLLLPKWTMHLTNRTHAAFQAVDELKKYMSEMIQQRVQEAKVDRYDLFSSLLSANFQSLDGTTLTEDELMGNIFVFLLAGHEATHTLAFTFGLLALYQDEQEKLHQHIKSVLADGREPTYDDMKHLTYSMAVFYETLRLFPPVTEIPKQAMEDTVLSTSNIQGDTKSVSIPKGTYVTISTAGLHYNPRYWPEPESFNPSRFLKPDWPRDAFLPFSSGPRACIGRKFSETEGIAALTLMVSKYKITVKEEPQFVNETFNERKARVLNTRAGISLTPVNVPLVFTRR